MKIKGIHFFYFLSPIKIPITNPMNANIMAACNAWVLAIVYENELFIKSQTQNTKPPKIPNKTVVNRVYVKSTFMYTPLFKLIP